LFSCGSFAQTNLDFIKTQGDWLFLATVNEKTHTMPSCITSDTARQWTINIKTDEGRAAMVLVSLAMNSGYLVELISSGECENGIERIKNITLISPSN
jgi:hypothetical protein